MNDQLQHIRQLQQVLQLEKEEDYEQFKVFVESLSLAEKRKKGFSWHPIQVLKQGYTYGERAFVIVRRTTSLETPHSFRPGKVINLYTSQPAVHRPKRSGVIQYVDQQK